MFYNFKLHDNKIKSKEECCCHWTRWGQSYHSLKMHVPFCIFVGLSSLINIVDPCSFVVVTNCRKRLGRYYGDFFGDSSPWGSAWDGCMAYIIFCSIIDVEPCSLVAPRNTYHTNGGCEQTLEDECPTSRIVQGMIYGELRTQHIYRKEMPTLQEV